MSQSPSLDLRMALSSQINRNRRIQVLPMLAVCILATIFANNVPSVASASFGGGHGGSALMPMSPSLRQQPAAFTLTMMGSRRGKGGNLKRSLDDKKRGGSVQRINGGRGQEITGVTLPEKGKIRGWAFGEDRTICSANVDGKFYAVDGACPRCGFDLYKGKLLDDKDVWGPEPVVACPTCSTTYSLKTGKFGPEYKATGLTGWVNTWAQTATAYNAAKDVPAYDITRDRETGQVFCRER